MYYFALSHVVGKSKSQSNYASGKTGMLTTDRDALLWEDDSELFEPSFAIGSL